MTTVVRPPCTAQHTDDQNTWGCVARLGDYHVAEIDGVIARLWRDLDQPVTDDPDRYGDLLDAVERLIAPIRGRAADRRVRDVITAYDALCNPGAGAAS